MVSRKNADDGRPCIRVLVYPVLFEPIPARAARHSNADGVDGQDCSARDDDEI